MFLNGRVLFKAREDLSPKTEGSTSRASRLCVTSALPARTNSSFGKRARAVTRMPPLRHDKWKRRISTLGISPRSIAYRSMERSLTNEEVDAIQFELRRRAGEDPTLELR